MSIPHFKSQHDWEAFTQIFDSQWHCKKALLDRVKDDMLPGYNWDQLQPQTMEVINDIVSNLLYDVDCKFKETHQDYKTDDDDMFIPYRSFKENVTEALESALDAYHVKKECPPCDTLYSEDVDSANGVA